MSRSVPIWRGKSSDSAIPPRVRLRVFERFNGICQETGRKIRAGDQWDCDHIVALINGGSHSEDNLRPVLREAHRKKTAADVAEKSKTARMKAKHLGAAGPKRSFATNKSGPWKRKLNGELVRR